MRERIKLYGGIAADVGIGAILGVLAVLATLVVGALIAAILAVILFGLIAACLLVTPLLAVFFGLCLLVGYPISSGRVIKQKLAEFSKRIPLEVPVRGGNITHHEQN